MPVVFPVTDKVKVRANGRQDNIFAVEACWWLRWCFSGSWCRFPLKAELVLSSICWKCSTLKSLDGICSTPLPGWMEAVKKERFMKMKAKSYTRTHAHPRCLPSFTRSVSGAHLFRKAERGLSVSFTLEVK